MQLLCVVLVGLTLAALTSQWRRPTVQREQAQHQRYAYCPECGLELTLPIDGSQKPMTCPHCGPAKQMEINSFSRTNGEGPAIPLNRPLLVALFAVPIGLAITFYAVSARRQKRSLDADSELFRFKCPGCGHIMESMTYRQGSTAVCPACAELFVVTKADGDASSSARTDKAKDLEDGIRSALRKKKRGDRKRKKL
jgi:uncharacterized paraquat-inducible protein A